MSNPARQSKRFKPILSGLTWGEMLRVEVYFGFALLIILNAIWIPSYDSAFAKAKLSEMPALISPFKIAWQEEFALSGQGLSSIQAKPSSHVEPAVFAAEDKGMIRSGRYVSSITRIENSLIGKSILDDEKTSYFLIYSPAIIANSVPGSMRWLCGNRRPPAGWIRLSGPSGTDIPEKYLYSICRDNKET